MCVFMYRERESILKVEMMFNSQVLLRHALNITPTPMDNSVVHRWILGNVGCFPVQIHSRALE
jgi:hypothetical protein